MSPFTKWLIDRLREQSTWTSMAALIATMTWLPESKQIADLLPHVGIVLIAVIKILLPDNVHIIPVPPKNIPTQPKPVATTNTIVPPKPKASLKKK